MWLTDKTISSSAEAHASENISVLESLRKGDTNAAINLLEIRLDGDLITLQATDGAKKPSEIDPSLVKTLGRAANYRTKFPHTSGSIEVDSTVSNVLVIPSKAGRTNF